MKRLDLVIEGMNIHDGEPVHGTDFAPNVIGIGIERPGSLFEQWPVQLTSHALAQASRRWSWPKR